MVGKNKSVLSERRRTTRCVSHIANLCAVTMVRCLREHVDGLLIDTYIWFDKTLVIGVFHDICDMNNDTYIIIKYMRCHRQVRVYSRSLSGQCSASYHSGQLSMRCHLEVRVYSRSLPGERSASYHSVVHPITVASSPALRETRCRTFKTIPKLKTLWSS